MRCSDARRARRRARSTAETRGGSAQCTRVARFRVCGAGASCIGAPFAERARSAHVGHWVCKFVSARRASPARRSKRTATEDGGRRGRQPVHGRAPAACPGLGRQWRSAGQRSNRASQIAHHGSLRNRRMTASLAIGTFRPPAPMRFPTRAQRTEKSPAAAACAAASSARPCRHPATNAHARSPSNAREAKAEDRARRRRSGRAAPSGRPARARQPCPVRLSRAPASAR
ncbi:hypothetical protein Y025_2020 [Burkholderia pseudomallei TSV32]|nr:hypothetical protein Y025_2020 [Burkholderia pseudomallei TSV32]